MTEASRIKQRRGASEAGQFAAVMLPSWNPIVFHHWHGIFFRLKLPLLGSYDGADLACSEVNGLMMNGCLQPVNLWNDTVCFPKIQVLDGDKTCVVLMAVEAPHTSLALLWLIATQRSLSIFIDQSHSDPP